MADGRLEDAGDMEAGLEPGLARAHGYEDGEDFETNLEAEREMEADARVRQRHGPPRQRQRATEEPEDDDGATNEESGGGAPRRRRQRVAAKSQAAQPVASASTCAYTLPAAFSTRARMRTPRGCASCCRASCAWGATPRRQAH